MNSISNNYPSTPKFQKWASSISSNSRNSILNTILKKGIQDKDKAIVTNVINKLNTEQLALLLPKLEEETYKLSVALKLCVHESCDRS